MIAGPVSCAEWLRENGFDSGCMDREELEKATRPPDPSVYQRMPLPSWIVVHHSATLTGSAGLFRCLHRAVNGWQDIGYHFVIGNGSHSGDGEVEMGRPGGARGAHAKGSNHCSLGICLVGNFEDEEPTERQMESLGKLTATLMKRFGLKEDCILLHRSVPGCSTVCPGRNLTLEMVLRAAREASTC